MWASLRELQNTTFNREVFREKQVGLQYEKNYEIEKGVSSKDFNKKRAYEETRQ